MGKELWEIRILTFNIKPTARPSKFATRVADGRFDRRYTPFVSNRKETVINPSEDLVDTLGGALDQLLDLRQQREERESELRVERESINRQRLRDLVRTGPSPSWTWLEFYTA